MEPILMTGCWRWPRRRLCPRRFFLKTMTLLSFLFSRMVALTLAPSTGRCRAHAFADHEDFVEVDGVTCCIGKALTLRMSPSTTVN